MYKYMRTIRINFIFIDITKRDYLFRTLQCYRLTIPHSDDENIEVKYLLCGSSQDTSIAHIKFCQRNNMSTCLSQ